MEFKTDSESHQSRVSRIERSPEVSSTTHTHSRGEVQSFETSEVKPRRLLKAAAVTQSQHGLSVNIGIDMIKKKNRRREEHTGGKTTAVRTGIKHQTRENVSLLADRRAFFFFFVIFLSFPFILTNAVPKSSRRKIPTLTIWADLAKHSQPQPLFDIIITHFPELWPLSVWDK